ncbi:MAG: imidazolonepropionase [Legionella sp.]|nr:imidazolonepropionase [Legionella sp.]
MSVCDKILVNASTCTPQGLQKENQAIVIAQGRILWCGNGQDLPPEYASQTVSFEDCKNKLVTPGLIDCHTHLVYAGNRADEFKQRLEGVTYSEIAKAGGGILSTVRQTRAASSDELLQQSLPRLKALCNEGVTTVEIKSGYGLDLETEIKMLKVARQLGELTGVRVKTTFLGAHAVGPEFKQNIQAYVDYICREMLPAMAESGLADAVDVFCEKIAFSRTQTEQLFLKSHELGLPIKCHAEQLSNLGASELAASMGALSCDHLEFIDRKGVEAMASSGTVAVLLPGAYYFLRETHKPPVPLFRELGVGMAIASDSNPGTSPTASLLLMMSMGCRFFDLTVAEVLAGVTYQAARALGIHHETGAIAPGLAADLVRWDVNENAALCYHFGYPLPHATMIAGQWVF